MVFKCVSALIAISQLTLAEQESKPSFSCANAKTPIETAICNSSELGLLDNILGKIYAIALNNSSSPQTIKDEQKAWISRRDKEIKTLATHYQSRIQSLLSDKKLAAKALNLLIDSDQQPKDHVPNFKAVLATFLIDSLTTTPTSDSAPLNKRIASTVHILSDHRLIVFYYTFLGPYNTGFDTYIIDLAMPIRLKKLLFPKYDSSGNIITTTESRVISPEYLAEKSEISSYEKGAGYGGYSRSYQYKLQGDQLILISQKATKDNFDSTYKLIGDSDADWVTEYPQNPSK